MQRNTTHHDTRYTIHDTRYTIHDTRYAVHDARYNMIQYDTIQYNNATRKTTTTQRGKTGRVALACT
eukprot:980840-Lingulodinium_polyedra.AAC.1